MVRKVDSSAYGFRDTKQEAENIPEHTLQHRSSTEDPDPDGSEPRDSTGEETRPRSRETDQHNLSGSARLISAQASAAVA